MRQSRIKALNKHISLHFSTFQILQYIIRRNHRNNAELNFRIKQKRFVWQHLVSIPVIFQPRVIPLDYRISTCTRH
jgi:hypothetical protein